MVRVAESVFGAKGSTDGRKVNETKWGEPNLVKFLELGIPVHYYLEQTLDQY